MKELWLRGDLCQMGNQARALQEMGFELRREDVYRILDPEYVEQALIYIYKNNIDGWWNYCDICVELGICTEDEFRIKLKTFVDNKERS